jgi:hypothetical protein
VKVAKAGDAMMFFDSGSASVVGSGDGEVLQHRGKEKGEGMAIN